MARDDEAFTRFATQHARSLYGRAFLLTSDHHLAEDLVQDTLAKLYLNWSSVDRAGNPGAYARTTLTHLFIDKMRRKSSTERPTDALPESHGPGEVDTVVDRVTVERLLDQLNPTQRVVIVARYLDDLSIADTASLLGKTEAWVRQATHRAITALRRPELLVELGEH